MSILLLKLTVTPSLIYLANSASKRWGHAIGGWIVALPLTAGPVVFFLALEHGREFAALAAVGCLAGALAEAGFCLGYGWCARQFPWPLSFLTGTLAFGVIAVGLKQFDLRLTLLCPVVVLALVTALALMPRGSAGPGEGRRRSWDVPVRMAIATGVVVLLTASANAVGPTLSGVFATFPIYAATLTTFAHHLEGWRAGVQVLRGLLYGLFGFAAFFTILATVIGRSSIAVSFLAAISIGLAVQVGSLRVLQRAS